MLADSSSKRAKELFTEATERPPTERADYLDEVCGDDTDLRQRVEALLTAHDKAQEFLETPPATDVPGDDDEALAAEKAALLGERIGQYRLDRVIATGGMGTVYEAVQEKPRRSVAVKVMRRAIASKSALRRFEYESQILARLRHPGIAQIYEAGRYEDPGAPGDGVPYFAMELIADAKPITDYAKGRKLNMRQRLDLFTKVCDAVHHGHRKGVIHRDLKPSNILVDAEGEPKVIDFGVARATDSDIAITTLQTDVGQLIGTLQYMSPEQCEGHAHDLDTRTDVYSLGVVLYELLCDQVPYNVSNGTVPQAIQVIREEVPARPSTINRALRGDLETITLKALEKERQRRYDSAAALADDLRRYLNDEPILARSASAIYQFRKFTRRNKGLVMGMAVAALALIGGTVVAVTYAVRESEQRSLAEQREQQARDARADAQRQAEIAQAVNEIFTDLVSAMNPDPQLGLGRETTVVEVLQQWESKLETLVANQPLVEAAIRDVIGTTYRDLGRYDRAVTNLRKEVILRETHQGKEHSETLDAMLNLGSVLDSTAKVDEAETLIRHVYKTRLRLLGKDNDATLHAAARLVSHLNRTKQYDEAEPVARMAMEAHRKLYDEHHPGTLVHMRLLASVLSGQRRGDEAESLYREVLRHNRRALGNEHSETLSTITDLAWHLLQKMHRPADAEQLFREVLATGIGVYDQTHPRMLVAQDGLIRTLIDQRHNDDVEAEMRKLLTAMRRRHGSDHPQVANAMHHLAEVLLQNGKRDEAESLGRESLVLYHDLPDSYAEEHAHAAQVLAKILVAKGNPEEAVMLLSEALDQCRVAFGNKHLTTASAMEHLGHRNWALQRFEEAEELYSASLAIHRELLGPEHRKTLSSMSDLAAQYQGQAKTREARELGVEVLEIRRRTLGDEDPDTIRSMNDVGVSYWAQGQFEQAAELLQYALQGRIRLFSEEHPDTVMTMYNLATQYTELGRYSDAEPLFSRVIEICERVPPRYVWLLANYRGGYGECLTKLERFEEAEDQLLVAYEGLKAALGESHKRTKKTARRLADLYNVWGKPDDAAQWRAKLPDEVNSNEQDD